nr:arginase family protein [Geodermatophilus normandii]
MLSAPWDSGVHDARKGAGPSALLRAGAADRLWARGSRVTRTALGPASDWQAELRTAFELQRAVARSAAAAHADGELPLLLSGDCHLTLGMVAALQGRGARVGLLWLDAHGDLDTPEVDPGAYLDGQGLAMVLGRCWQAATATVPAFTPLPEEQVVLVGARDLDPPRADVVHLHVDLDVYAPSIAPANGYAAPDGLPAADVLRIARQAAARVPVGSAALASYDPSYDPAGRLRDTALDLLEALASLPD